MDLHIVKECATDAIPRLTTYGPPIENWIDPHNQESVDASFSVKKELPLLLAPGRRVMLRTQETVEIPPEHVGLIGLRSTFARLGLMTPPTVADPGFHGTLTLELINFNARSILIRPFERIWHMIIVPAPYEPMYTGRYQNQHALQLPIVSEGEQLSLIE